MYCTDIPFTRIHNLGAGTFHMKQLLCPTYFLLGCRKLVVDGLIWRNPVPDGIVCKPLEMDPKNYQFKNSGFELNTKNTFKNLLGEKNFSDVTLACSDNKQVKAHEVILGACSPFFQRNLAQKPSPASFIISEGHQY